MQGQAEPGTADASGVELFAEDGVEPEVVGTAASVLLGDRQADEAVLTGGGVHLAWGDSRLLPLEVVRRHLLCDK